MGINYVLPDKSLLEKSDDKFTLSKITLKKDLNEKLIIPIGIDDNKEKYFANLKNISGILVSGSSGTGKSVFINSIIISLLLRNKPDELKFLFIDPRGVEFSDYNGIPHLFENSISNLKESIKSLKKINKILDKRIKIFKKNDIKDINEYDKPLERYFIITDEACEIFNNKKGKEIIKKILLCGKLYGIHILLSTNSYFKNYFEKEDINSFDYILTYDLASLEQANYIELKGSHLISDAMIKYEHKKISNIKTPYVSDNDIKNIVDFIKKQVD